METRATRISLWAWMLLVVLFLYAPIAIIVVYAFNESNIQSWPIEGFTTKWFASTWHNQEVRDALLLSLKAALAATAIAPPEAELARAIEVLRAASKPAIVIGNGARPSSVIIRSRTCCIGRCMKWSDGRHPKRDPSWDRTS